MSAVRALGSFTGKSLKYTPMPWQNKMEFMKATLLCFLPVGSWAVYQETELYKIRTDDSYLDEILKGSEAMTQPGAPQNTGMTKQQFQAQYSDKINTEESRVKKRLEEEAYAALK